jgi:glycosyltransferase involved in cell wall biosynthesis
MMVRPRFSIVTPVYNTRRRHLEECLTSVLSQTFTDWELCVVDDKSPKESVRRTLRRAARLDDRIRIKFRDTNGGIVAASNDGLSMATGDFVVLLDHDDVLEPDALELVNNLLDSDELIDYVYTDESLITEDGRVLERFYKPDWSPERFRHQMYVCHLSVIRRTLMADVGGFREGFDGAQDYDLMFRVTESARRIGHVPHLLYHWRMAKTSVANNASAKPYAYEAGKRAIEAHVKRIGLDADVENVEKYPGNYRLVRRATTDISARLFVSAADWNVEVWGGANKSRASATRQLTKLAGIDIPIELVNESRPFLPEVNQLAQTTQDDVIVVAGPMVEPISPDWVTELLSPFDDPQIGIVSGVTYTPNSLVDHAGYFLNGSYLESNCFRLGIADRGQRAILETKFEMSAVDSGCMAIRRDLFQRLEGFDESLVPTWAAVDFCLRARALGYGIIVNPWVKFFDFSNNDDFARARVRVPKSFREKWRKAFASDPYRPRYPMRMSDESRRPHWQPLGLREFRKQSRE